MIDMTAKTINGNTDIGGASDVKKILPIGVIVGFSSLSSKCW